MEYRPSNNPEVLRLQKSTRERHVTLDTLKPFEIGGQRVCVWCCRKPINRRAKYCDDQCRLSAWAWAYPQKEEGLYFLLLRQKATCNLCGYQWPRCYASGRYDWAAMKRIKRRAEEGRKPEVDHVVPISKGGEAVGLSNHQVLCTTCHRNKTRTDLSGPRTR